MNTFFCRITTFLCLTLSACGGGSGGNSTNNTDGTIEKTSIQAEGPGDAGKYFPLTQGDTWTFKTTTHETGKTPVISQETMQITGTKTIDGYEATVMTFTGNASPLGEEYYVKTGAGLYYFGSNSTSMAAPYQLLSFPLQVNDSFVQIDASLIDYGDDLDGDGRNERISIKTVVNLVGFETVAVDAGTFSDCARIETTITETVHLSSNREQVTLTGSEIDWYAPTAGPIKKHVAYSSGNRSKTLDYTLTSFKVSGYKNDRVSPTVVSTQPATGSTVNPSTPIQVTFSEDMDPQSLNGASFIVTNLVNQPVAGTISYGNKTATFTPSFPLISGTYSAAVTTLVQDLAENRLASNVSWRFTIDADAPGVFTFSPANGATNVAVSTPIVVTFSEPMDTRTAGSSFTVKDSANLPVAGQIASNGNTLTFTPALPLIANSTYTVSLSTQLQDMNGNPLSGSYSWGFTTTSGRFLPYLIAGSGSSPKAVAIGDVNGDGKNDIVTVTGFGSDPASNYKLLVFIQNNAGGLEPPVKYDVSAETVAIGDVNHDGVNEVVVGCSGNIKIMVPNGSGGLTIGATYPASDSDKIRIGDLNNDGRLDVVGIGPSTGTVSVWLQNGSGTLNAPDSYAVLHSGNDDVRVGDLNNDGRNDIVVLNNGHSPNFGVLTQAPGLPFNPPAYYWDSLPGRSAIVSNGIAVGDVNGDGRNDVVMSGSIMAVIAQNRDGMLDPARHYAAYQEVVPVEVGDINNDGRMDVVVRHRSWSGANAVGVYIQNADGSLANEELFAVPHAIDSNPRSLAVGDINGDGLNDIIIADASRGLILLYANSALTMPKRALKQSSGSIIQKLLGRVKMRR